MGDPVNYQRNFPVSWDELHRNAKALAWRLVDKAPDGQWKGIIAVARGGLVPAAIIARELEVKLIDTVCISSYEDAAIASGAAGGSQKTAHVLKGLSGHDGEGWLVIDDLVDTGRTFEVIRQMLPKAHIATIYAKPAGRPMVDTYITEVSQDTWIFFPWDVEPQFSQPIALLKK